MTIGMDLSRAMGVDEATLGFSFIFLLTFYYFDFDFDFKIKRY
jgi:hypothetical protein